MNITFLDVETTGFDPNKHEIISYCLQNWSVRDGKVVYGRRCQGLILPEGECEPQAAKVNGYTWDKWIAQGARPFDYRHGGEIIEVLAEFDRLPTVGGHNVGFDIGFFEALFKRNGLTFNISHRKVDTQALAQPLVALGLINSASLDACRAFFGLGTTGAHTAIGDVQTTIEVWEKFLGLYQAGLSDGV